MLLTAEVPNNSLKITPADETNYMRAIKGSTSEITCSSSKQAITDE